MLCTDNGLNSLTIELRSIADHCDAKGLVETYRRGDVGRMEARRPVLRRRRRRWFEDVGPRVDGVVTLWEVGRFGVGTPHMAIGVVHDISGQPSG